mmetsp:Transcript_113181/g.205873  ORF Transcript_113181/g.205873 Transcript_113181/m.205873 type:complete len:495 (+) Transcript_113181:65-1549(+)
MSDSWAEVDPDTYWSQYQCFEIRNDEVDPELELKEQTCLQDALEQLNRQLINPPLGFCIIFSEASQASYVLYRGDSKMAAFDRFGRTEASVPSRLVAAKAVAKQRFVLLPLAVLLYRFMEFNAQVSLLTFLTWFIRPSVLSVMFILLWYLPAARHVASLGKPIGYPLLNFVVDDFSFLSLHPTPRNASCMYMLAATRVCLMFCLILLLFILPEQVRDVIAHSPVIDQFNHFDVHGLEVYIRECWIALGAVVVFSSLLWLCIIVFTFLKKQCGGRPSPILGVRDDAMLFRVDELASKIEVAAQLEPAECREELLRLKRDEPRLQLVNFVSVFGPAWAILLHIGIDMFNIYNFIVGEDYIRAALLALAILITVCYMANTTEHGLLSLYHECKESWDRGMFTDDYLKFVRADKGIQAIPALIIVMSGLPFKEFKAGNLKSTVGGLGSIAINLALVVPFIMQEFDLGIEKDGFEPPEPEPIQNGVEAGSAAEMSDPLR